MIKRTVQKHGITFLKYAVVGVSGTLIDVLIYTVLVSSTNLGVDWHGRTAAATCGFLIAVLNNYTWNRLWTFQSRHRKMGKEFFTFFVVSCGGWLLNILCVISLSWVVYHILNLAAVADLPAWANALVKIGASGIVLVYNFIGNRFWTFKEKL